MNTRLSKKLFGLWLGSVLLLAACQPTQPSGAIYVAATATPVPAAVVPVTGGVAESISPAVAVQDQEIKNGTVAVDKVISSGSGWLVIYADENGAPGVEIGRTGVHAGENDGLLVNIAAERATPVLYASLHVDRGIVGAYEYPGPDEPVIVDGQGIASSFHASLPVAQAPVTGSDANPAPRGNYTFVIPYGSDLQTIRTQSDPARIHVGETAALGKYLTDGSGMTVYMFKKDAPNQSSCSGSCQMFWQPVLTTGDPQGSGELHGRLGTITLADGTQQVTYLGKPLYRYAADARPGDTLGHGVGNVWSIVDP